MMTNDKRRLALFLLACALICLICFRAWRLELVDRVTDRVRFHVIPVAISYLYHGHPHDYTAYRADAMPFQTPHLSLESVLIGRLEDPDPNRTSTYYWVADDRGFADFAILAFRLFGPATRSMYALWCIAFTASALVFAMTYRRDIAAMGIFCLTLVGIHIAISCLPLVHEGHFFEVSSGLAPDVAVYEPRFLEVTALLAVLHLVFIAASTSRPRPAQVAAVVLQVFALIFYYHCRSSLGWEFLAIIAYAGLVLAGRIRSARRQQPPAGTVMTTSSGAVLALVLLVCGVAALNVYKRETYNAHYFAEMGARTFWHNAIIGLAFDPGLAKTYQLEEATDAAATGAILRYAKTLGCSADLTRKTTQNILNSLGGHETVDWQSYEVCAQRLYLSLLTTHPLSFLKRYTYEGAWIVGKTWLRTMARTGNLLEDLERDQLSVGYMPWRPINSLPGIAAIVLCAPELRRRLRPIIVGLGALLVCSLIPAWFFYSAVLTLGGFLALSTVFFYLILGWVAWSVWRWAFEEDPDMRLERRSRCDA